MSCCYELGRDHSEDLPEEEVQEEDGTEESLSGQVKSDKEDTDGQTELGENFEGNEETKFKKQFLNLTPDSVEKLFSLTSIPCHQGIFVWDCELCLEMLLLELKLSFDLDT